MLNPDRHKTYNVASQATPTSAPVGHPLMRCHKPALSSPFCPLQPENKERRSFSVMLLLQFTFHGVEGCAELGHLRRIGSERASIRTQKSKTHDAFCTWSSII